MTLLEEHLKPEFSDLPFHLALCAKPAPAIPEYPGTLNRYGLLYGGSLKMKRLFDMIEKVAPTDATVLIIGESGTGKELVANTLHQKSLRRDAPFIPVNCGAIASNLIEAELFGYERGSFTGANKQHKGYFERAAGGTLFLDEITEMAPDLQVKLLRLLETGTFCRVGGDQEIKLKVRIIAATNRNPYTAMTEGQLREDLFYRLSVFPIEIPPLRERAEDITLLAQHFIHLLNTADHTQKSLSTRALAAIKSHTWPGNVRELKNLMQRAFILAEKIIELDGLIRSNTKERVKTDDEEMLHFSVGMPLAEIERSIIFATLERHEGNKKKAAEILGLSLKTLYNRLSEYQAHSVNALPANAFH